jgi:chondroitin AC lyase
MGTDIRAEKSMPVITSVNQCFSSGDITLKEGKAKSALKEEERTGNISWIWHDRFGYVFPTAAKVTVRNAEQSGSWSEINNSQSRETTSSKVFSAWINHDADHKSYEYIIVPSASPAKLEKWNAKNPFTLITNTTDMQAAYNRSTGIYAIALYRPGTLTISGKLYIGADKPCIMLYKAEKGNKFRVTVADPTQKLDKIILLVSARVSGEGVAIHEKTSEISVNLPSGDDAGKSVSVELSYL